MSQPTPPAAASATALAPAHLGQTGQIAQTAEVFPNASALLQAAKLAMAQDKPIQLDYYAETASGKAFMGEDAETKEKMLVKSAEEFTSLIQKVYKVAEDYIIMTENSIYLVSGRVQKRRIQANSLKNE